MSPKFADLFQALLYFTEHKLVHVKLLLILGLLCRRGSRLTLPKMSTLRNNLCLLGFILSAYAVYVEHKTNEAAHEAENDPLNSFEPFVALCDIESIGASCSSTFNLPQGKLLSYFGIVPSGHLLDVPNGKRILLRRFVFFSYDCWKNAT
uniref:Uncharacterized protein n=1 Tax=Corethron hystrix TaxID=216773 RepID=A0A7S1BEW5_9STRA